MFVLRWVFRFAAAIAVFLVLWIALYSFVNPPTTAYIVSEARRLGDIRREWRSYSDVSPHMARAIVAAEDANFCEHWGFDMGAIRSALADGSGRGASTISQQTVKNVFLWHGRNWTRKALETLITPVMEAIWTKNRIVEVYMNIAEFDEGVFGVGAASYWYFGVDARDLTEKQASLLAAILPNPKQRSAKNPSNFVQRRARSISSGAATILADGRSGCFDG
ncbi:MAG: monofunctional biosynthetic peptidoglycan transglycosylase [Litoreibacter sp.]